MKDYNAIDKSVYLILCFLILAAVGCVALVHPGIRFVYKGVLLPPILGGIGSLSYCMRAVYIHKIQLKNHDTRFDAWLYLRPFVGIFRGMFVGLLFLVVFLLGNPSVYVAHKSLLSFVGLFALIEGYKPMFTKFFHKLIGDYDGY